MPMAGKVLRKRLNGTGTFEISVVGESYYQDSIRRILEAFANGPESTFPPDQFHRPATRTCANLVSDLSNPHDPNAIAVYINQLKVGHLDRIMAAKIRSQLQLLGFDSIDATCDAVIIGSIAEGSFREICEVRLDIQRKSQAADGSNKGRRMHYAFWLDRSSSVSMDCNVGERVKFWTKEEMGAEIRVYCENAKGNQMVGHVPSELVYSIRQRLLADLEYRAAIASMSENNLCIECHFVPQEETARLRLEILEQQRTRLIDELSKPYRPRKPIQISVLGNRDAAKKGDCFKVVELPTVNQLLEPHSVTIQLVCQRTGETIEKSHDNEFVKKLLRLRLPPEQLTFHVISKSSSKKPEIEFVLELRLEPSP